jgi:hypothetical protein
MINKGAFGVLGAVRGGWYEVGPDTHVPRLAGLVCCSYLKLRSDGDGSVKSFHRARRAVGGGSSRAEIRTRSTYILTSRTSDAECPSAPKLRMMEGATPRPVSPQLGIALGSSVSDISTCETDLAA